MDNPGIYVLASLSISAPKAIALLTPITDLEGMSSVTIEASFQYGSGGATCSAIIATTFDGGTTWRHIARFDFATATSVKVANLQVSSPKGIAVYADLASEGVAYEMLGVLGDQLAALVTSSGAYANTVLSVRASVR